MKTKYSNFLQVRLSLLLFLLCCGVPLIAQSNNIVEVGKTVSIHSKLKGLPVVEPHLSIHPDKEDHLLIAAMVITDVANPYQSARLSTFVSEDGGNNWTETMHNYWGYDPWTAILPTGQTALSWLGTPHEFKHQFPLNMFSSDDGGITWDEEVQVFTSNHGHDGTKIATSADNFYLTTVRFTNDMGADVVLYCRKSEEGFKEVAKVDGKGIRLNFCEPAILSDGKVLVPSSHFLRKFWVSVYDPVDQTLSGKNLVTINPGGDKGYMRMVVDRNLGSKFKDRAYFLRAIGRGQLNRGVWLNYSPDRGSTWSKDIRIDSFDNQLPSRAMLASLAVNADGVLGVSWVDSQHDKSQLETDVYFSYSVDGGKNFSKPIRITKVSTNARTAKNNDVANKFPGGGHYLDLKSKSDKSFQLVWSDSRSGIFELQTCNVRIKGIGMPANQSNKGSD